jgi:hypothetical protein
VLGPVVNVMAYGAKGDGVADDTAAIQAAAAQIQSAGGGTLLFPHGNYKVLPPVAAVSSVVPWIEFSGLDGIHIVGHGATITDANTYNATIGTATGSRVFSIASCDNMSLHGITYATQQIRQVGDGYNAFAGSAFVYLSGSTNGVSIDVSQTGGSACVRCQGVAGSTSQVRNISASIRAVECARPFACAFTGISVRANVWSRYASRAYAAYGCSDHDVSVWAEDSQLQTIIGSQDGGYGCSQMSLRYTNTNTTLTTASIAVRLEFVGTTPGFLRDIAVSIDCVNAPGRTTTNFSNSLEISKVLASGSPDTTGRGHVLENVWLSGRSSQAGLAPHLAIVGAFASPDVIQNVSKGPFVLLGMTRDPTRTALSVPSIQISGRSARGAAGLSGDLTVQRNVFRVWATTDVTIFTLKYVLVADRGNPSTNVTIGMKSFAAACFTTGAWWQTPIAVADAITERSAGTASALTVTLVNGDNNGALIAVTCTNYSGANARAAFELEIMSAGAASFATDGTALMLDIQNPIYVEPLT